MTFLATIEIANFKSFTKSHKFHFQKFNAVADIYGQGKTHFYEALLFVFAHKKITEAEILGSPFHQSEDDDSRISVSVQFRLPQNDRVTLRRTVVQSSSLYEVDDAKVTKRVYLQTLKDLHVDANIIDRINEGLPTWKPKCVTEMLEIFSGSIKLKDKYDELSKDITNFYDKYKVEFSEKKLLSAKLKMMKQKLVQSRANALEIQNLKEMKLSYFLTVLYHLDNEIRRLKVAQIELKSSRPILQQGRDLQALQNRLNVLEKEISDLLNYLAEKNEIIRMHPGICKDIENKKAAQINLLENARTRQKCLNDEASLLARQITEVVEKEAELLKKDRNNYEWKKLLEEFHSLDLEVMKATASETEKLRGLTLKCEVKAASTNRAQRKIDSALSLIAEQTLEIEKGRSEVSVLNKFIDQKTAEKERTEKIENDKRTLEKLKEKFRNLSTEIVSNAADCDRLRKREQYNQKADEELKNRFGTKVFGRISRVCRTKKKEYEVAMMSIFEENIDAIVVDSERTAVQCIEHLRSWLGEETEAENFIPLDSVKYRPVNTALRSIKDPIGTVVALDALDFPEEVRPAVLYVTKNFVICRTNEDALKLAFNSESPQQSANAVSLSGFRCSRAGYATYDADISTGGSKWAAQKMADLELQRGEVSLEIKNLAENLNASGSTEPLSVLKSQIAQTQVERDGILKKIDRMSHEIDVLRNTVESEQTQLLPFKSEMDDISKEIKLLEESIERKRDSYFRKFFRKVGVESYHALEKTMSIWLESERHQETIPQLKKDIEDQLEFICEEKKHNARKLSRWEEEIKLTEALMSRINDEHSKNLTEVVNVNVKKEKLQKARNELVKQIDDVRKCDEDESVKALRKLTRDIANKVEFRLELLMQCKADDIPIHVTDNVRTVNELSDDELRSGRFLLDYSVLRASHKSMSSQALKAFKEEMEDKILNKIQELSEECSSCVEVSQFEGQKLVLKRSETTCKQLNAKLQDKKAELARIASQRFELFMTCFQRISRTAELIYQKLNQPGSDFQLLLLNPSEPYLEGTVVSCMPGSNPLLHLENMSSGEKTKAMVSFILALFEYWPGTFMIFEGLEVNLDLPSVDQLAQCISQLTKDNENFQVVVISSKERFICRTNLIIGLFRDRDEYSSTKAVCMDLN